jgi:hypothetical protein
MISPKNPEAFAYFAHAGPGRFLIPVLPNPVVQNGYSVPLLRIVGQGVPASAKSSCPKEIP